MRHRSRASRQAGRGELLCLRAHGVQMGQAASHNHRLEDRSSRPQLSPRRLPVETVNTIVELWRQRWTGARIAAHLGLSRATLSRYPRRAGLNRAPTGTRRARHSLREGPGRRIAPPRHEEARTHPAPRPSHYRLPPSPRPRQDRLGVRLRGHRRLFASGLRRDLRRRTPAHRSHPLKAAITNYAGLGIAGKHDRQRACFISHTFARACAQLRLKHILTRPDTPRTNGKAERLIRTSMREWAYHASYDHSGARLAALAPWLHHYNWHRPHYSLSTKPPASRPQLSPDDLLKLHT